MVTRGKFSDIMNIGRAGKSGSTTRGQGQNTCNKQKESHAQDHEVKQEVVAKTQYKRRVSSSASQLLKKLRLIGSSKSDQPLPESLDREDSSTGSSEGLNRNASKEQAAHPELADIGDNGEAPADQGEAGGEAEHHESSDDATILLPDSQHQNTAALQSVAGPSRADPEDGDDEDAISYTSELSSFCNESGVMRSGVVEGNLTTARGNLTKGRKTQRQKLKPEPKQKTEPESDPESESESKSESDSEVEQEPQPQPGAVDVGEHYKDSDSARSIMIDERFPGQQY